MKLLLFGGTFDPPHTGHINILENAIAAVQPDEVWVMPAGVPPHKQASAAPAALRLQMCGCFSPLFPGLVVSDWEIRQQGKSYTLNTVEWLLRQKLGAEIFLCVGSDMLLGFTAWHRWRQLLQMVVLVVQSRAVGDDAALYAAAQVLKAEGGRVLFAGGAVEEVSSSGLRAALAAGQDVWDKIPPQAAAVIRQNGLYAAQP